MARAKRAMHARRQLRDAAGKFATGMQPGGGGQGSSMDGMQPGGGGGHGYSAHGDGSKRSSSPPGGYRSGQGPSAPRCPKCLKMEKRFLKLEKQIKKLKLRQFYLGKKVWVHGSKLYDL